MVIQSLIWARFYTFSAITTLIPNFLCVIAFIITNHFGKEYFISLPLPEDAVDWVNITAVFDREAGLIKQYCNFEPYAEGEIPAELDGVSFDADTFVIGNDASGTENEYINLMYDDLLIYGGALSTADVKKLREYYKG